MPVQKSTVSLASKLGARLNQAAAVHQHDDVEFSSFGDLPPGIENGIAQLIDAKFDIYKTGANQGNFYFMAQGIVLFPAEAVSFDANGIPNGTQKVQGLRTKIGPEPICDTPNAKGQRKSLADHVGWVQNELKKLGAAPDSLDGASLEVTAKALVEAKVTFRFSTRRSKATPEYPNPSTFHSWNGTVVYEPEESSAVQDDTAQATANGSPKAPPARKMGTAKKEPEPEPAQEEAQDFSEFDDLDSLAERADSGEKEAMNKLKQMASDAGLDDDAVKNADDWATVAGWIQAGGTDQEEPEEEEEASEEYTPSVGDVVNYTPVGLNGKPGKMTYEVTVTAVQVKAKTVDVKNVATKKVTNKVPWDQLAPIDS